MNHNVAAVGLSGGAVYMTEERLQRRLAAILSADVVGYSRLMGLDEVGTARMLREHHRGDRMHSWQHGGRETYQF